MIGSAIGAAGIGATTAASQVQNVAYITLDDWTLVATGALSINGSATIDLEDWTLVAIGVSSSEGAATIVLDDWYVVATAEVSGRPSCIRLQARSSRFPVAMRGVRNTKVDIYGGCH